MKGGIKIKQIKIKYIALKKIGYRTPIDQDRSIRSFLVLSPLLPTLANLALQNTSTHFQPTPGKFIESLFAHVQR